MIEVEKLTQFQTRIYPLILRTIVEIVDDHEEPTYNKIQTRIKEKNIPGIHGVDVQLSLLTLLNNSVLNIVDGVYSFNFFQKESILELAKFLDNVN